MKISYNWLSSYLDMSGAEGGVPTAESLAERLSASGIDVEGITYLRAADGEVTRDDAVIEIRVSREMSDYSGMMWTANEVAGVLGIQIDDTETYGKLLPDDRWVRQETDETALYVNSVSKRCRMLVGRIVGGVEARRSPDWMRDALVANGITPTSCLEDVPAFVTRNLGQPMFVIDADRLATDRLIVEDAAHGGTVTCDGVAYEYVPGDVVLTNGEKVVGICGVVTDDSVKVGEDTARVLAFTMIIDADTVRDTARRLGVSSLNVEVASLGANHASEMKAIGNLTSYLYECAGASHFEPLDIFTKYDFTKSIMDTTVRELNDLLSSDYTYAQIVSGVVNGKISAFVKQPVYDKNGNQVNVDVCEPSPYVGEDIHFGSKFGSYRNRREPCDLAQSILCFVGCDRVGMSDR